MLSQMRIFYCCLKISNWFFSFRGSLMRLHLQREEGGCMENSPSNLKYCPVNWIPLPYFCRKNYSNNALLYAELSLGILWHHNAHKSPFSPFPEVGREVQQGWAGQSVSRGPTPRVSWAGADPQVSTNDSLSQTARLWSSLLCVGFQTGNWEWCFHAQRADLIPIYQKMYSIQNHTWNREVPLDGGGSGGNDNEGEMDGDSQDLRLPEFKSWILLQLWMYLDWV